MRQPERILITGASGCVGQYITEELYRNSDADLLLLLRDPAKLQVVSPQDPRITLLIGDLRELGPHAEAIASATRIIHTATAWGDPARAQAEPWPLPRCLLRSIQWEQSCSRESF